MSHINIHIISCYEGKLNVFILYDIYLFSVCGLGLEASCAIVSSSKCQRIEGIRALSNTLYQTLVEQS